MYSAIKAITDCKKIQKTKKQNNNKEINECVRLNDIQMPHNKNKAKPEG